MNINQADVEGLPASAAKEQHQVDGERGQWEERGAPPWRSLWGSSPLPHRQPLPAHTQGEHLVQRRDGEESLMTSLQAP